MKIHSVLPDSMIEWPGHISYIIFLEGCNMQCGFCYVPHLSKPDKQNKGLSKEEVLDDIQKRIEFIDAVCITGGEPTLNEELPEFLQEIKEINSKLKIRIETNGTNPDMLYELLEKKLVDSIALDIKNTREKYNETCNSEIDISKLEATVSLLKALGEADFDYEMRTTLIPEIHDENEILEIVQWIHEIEPKGNMKIYVLQQFRNDLPDEKTLNPEFMKKGNYDYSKMLKIQELLEQQGFVDEIVVKGERK